MYDNEADIYVTIDADLQDDPECIAEMLEKVNHGAEVVYGVRRERSSDTFFKRVSAQAFYRLMHLLGVNIIYNHADFRMMTRRVVEELKKFPERNLFLRAVVPLVGFKSECVYYNRTPRLAGTTKYPLRKMLAFAWNGAVLSALFCGFSHFSARRLFCFENLFELQRARRRFRLGVHGDPDYPVQRRADDFHRHYRRIYRQDICGSQTPAVLHRG